METTLKVDETGALTIGREVLDAVPANAKLTLRRTGDAWSVDPQPDILNPEVLARPQSERIAEFLAYVEANGVHANLPDEALRRESIYED